jgi:hypothetical protein
MDCLLPGTPGLHQTDERALAGSERPWIPAEESRVGPHLVHLEQLFQDTATPVANMRHERQV